MYTQGTKWTEEVSSDRMIMQHIPRIRWHAVNPRYRKFFYLHGLLLRGLIGYTTLDRYPLDERRTRRKYLYL